MNRDFSILIVLIVLVLVGWMLMRSGDLPFFSNNQTDGGSVLEPVNSDEEPIDQGNSDDVVIGGCYVGGCSSQICSDQPDAVSTCEFREEYACYKSAKCERQSSGQCGWTQTSELTMCLNASLEL